MINDVKDIQKIRKTLGLTQKELASEAGVSQSLIAKMESGNLDPSFSNAKKIIEVLENYKKQTTILAKNIMTKDVEFIAPDDTTKQIIKIFRDKNYSQVPVRQDDIIVGIVTEKDLLNSLLSNKICVSDIMQEVPPFVNPNTTIDPIVSLLKHFPCVLVAEKGEIQGIITKSNVIGINEN